jgi:hypothetical protein
MNRPWKVSLLRCSILLAIIAVAVVCSRSQTQIESAGQMIPSPYWLDEDVQYFAPPGFKLQREAAAMRAYKADLDRQLPEQSAVGQSLPPVWFGVNDDVVYFAPDSELKLQRGAAAMKAQQERR